MEKIYQILSEIRPEVNFEKIDNFILDDVLDSLDIIQLVSQLELVYNIEFEPEEVQLENFETFDAIKSIVTQKIESRK